MDPSTAPLTGARRRVLEALLQDGPRTARELAAQLDVTPVAIRQQLTGLSRDGLAAPVSVADGRGRPASRWEARPAAQGRLADAHQPLSTEILRAASAAGVLDDLLDARTREQLARYQTLVEPDADLASRVDTLAQIRTLEGYMATAFVDEDGEILLAENHCPLHCAVQTCAGLCSAELDLFRRFVGPKVAVDRTEHMGSGERRCVYRFRAG